MKTLITILYFFFCITVYSQFKTSWYSAYSTEGNFSTDKAMFTVTDRLNNVIVTGITNGDGLNDDITTIKYDKDGKQLWMAVFNGTGSYHDRPNAMQVDNSGNVYITGTSTGANGTSSDIVTLKYSSEGSLLWSKIFAAPGGTLDEGKAIAVDAGGNVYVTGSTAHFVTENSGQDWITIKYDSNGEQVWAKGYDDNISTDKAEVLTIDNTGNIFVAGQCNGPAYHIGIAKYDNSGNLLWMTKYDGKSLSDDKPNDIIIDEAGNVYVAGHSSEGNKDILIIKLDNSGSIQWQKHYNGLANLRDEAENLIIDTKGNVYLLGRTETKKNKHHRIILKLDNSGNELWKIISDEPVSKNIDRLCLFSGKNDDIFVTGSTIKSNPPSELVIDHISAEGSLVSQIWLSVPNSIPVSSTGVMDYEDNILICGYILGAGNQNYCTVKFVK